MLAFSILFPFIHSYLLHTNKISVLVIHFILFLVHRFGLFMGKCRLENSCETIPLNPAKKINNNRLFLFNFCYFLGGQKWWLGWGLSGGSSFRYRLQENLHFIFKISWDCPFKNARIFILRIHGCLILCNAFSFFIRFCAVSKRT